MGNNNNMNGYHNDFVFNNNSNNRPQSLYNSNDCLLLPMAYSREFIANNVMVDVRK